MLNKLVNMLSKPFIGTGIGEKFPILKKSYDFVYSGLNKGLKSTTLEDGISITYSASDTGLGAFLTLKGAYEPVQTALFKKDIAVDSVFFDVGANIGYYSLIAANKGSNVVAFEPDAENLKLLLKNVKDNNFDDLVTIVNSPVGNRDENVVFSEDSKQKGNSKVVLNAKGNLVKQVTLDSYIKQNHVYPTVIKVDIEGYECEFLDGAEEVINQHKPILYIEYNTKALKERGYTPEYLIKKLHRLGYKLEIIDEVNKKVMEFSEENLNNALKKVPFTNFRCVKD